MYYYIIKMVCQVNDIFWKKNDILTPCFTEQSLINNIRNGIFTISYKNWNLRQKINKY